MLAIEGEEGPYADRGRGTISEGLIGDLSPYIAPGDPVCDLGGGITVGAGPYVIFLLGGDMLFVLYEFEGGGGGVCRVLIGSWPCWNSCVGESWTEVMAEGLPAGSCTAESSSSTSCVGGKDGILFSFGSYELEIVRPEGRAGSPDAGRVPL